MSIAPVSPDSLSLNGVLARLAGARFTPPQAVRAVDAAPGDVRRAGLEPVRPAPERVEGERDLARSVDGDLFEPTPSDTRRAPSHHAGDGHNHTPGDAQTPDDAGKLDSELTQDEQQQLAKLRATDAQVRAHEAAHQAAAGGLAQGGASFETTTGPDGREYATSGEVSIDTSPGANPAETIQKAQQIRKAALAPANPSSQDRAVAAKAAQMEAKARAELAKEQDAAAAPAGEKKTTGENTLSAARSSEDTASAAPTRDDALSLARVEQIPSSARVEQSSVNQSLAQRFDLTGALVGGALDLVA